MSRPFASVALLCVWTACNGGARGGGAPPESDAEISEPAVPADAMVGQDSAYAGDPAPAVDGGGAGGDDASAPVADDATSSVADDGGSGAPATGPQPSAACAMSGLPVPDGYQTLQVTGKARKFIVRVPKSYDGKHPLPVIFAFHGRGSNATSFDTKFGWRAAAGNTNILVMGEAYGAALTWERDYQDDLLYFDAVVDWLKTHACFDVGRIFATGQSSGAFFSYTLGCHRGGVLRALAPHAGGMRDFADCKGPVGALVAHGTMNETLLQTNKDMRDYWVKANGCSTMSRPVPGAPSFCVEYQGCQPGFPVVYCLDMTGHPWPDWASKVVVDFLARF